MTIHSLLISQLSGEEVRLTGKHWAIVIGINQYARMMSLRSAKQDAAAIRDLWLRDAKFAQVYYFSDNSPATTLDAGVTIATQPTFANLKWFLQVRFATPFLQPEDTLWVFFSGHGLHYSNQDYLMPSDADPDDAENTAIAIDDLTACLQQSGTHRIVLLLDACRTEEQQFGQGFGTDPESVFTIFATDFNQVSQEVEALNQGVFAVAVMEGFYPGKYRGTTLRHLYSFLHERVPRLALKYGKPKQVPRLHKDTELILEEVRVPYAIKRKPMQLLPIAAACGAIVIASGILGYVLYQNSVRSENPTGQNPVEKPDDRAKSDASKPVASTSKPRSDAPSNRAPAPQPDAEGLARTPKTGTYFAKMAQFGASRREIGRRESRFCIKLLDASEGGALGDRSKTLVSSLSLRADGIYIDATQEQLRLDTAYPEITDSRGIVWERLSNQVDETGLMAECLATNAVFVRQAQKQGE